MSPNRAEIGEIVFRITGVELTPSMSTDDALGYILEAMKKLEVMAQLRSEQGGVTFTSSWVTL